MALSAHYTIPTTFGEFMFGGTYAYVGKRYFDFQNFDSEDSYTRIDLQAHWSSATERYKVFAAVNNATDEEMYNTYGCGSNGDWDTPTWVVSCSGNPMNQRLWTVQFSVSL